MKYNTISTSSLSSEGRKSTLTLYTDPDFITDKVSTSESEITSIRGELEIAHRALKLQTRRCRQLVAEYTRRLQEKEHQYQSEKLLRDNQLTKVLRALLIFEARLKQEQKYISHQLNEKDYMIKKQRDDIHKLANQFCKHCNQFYNPNLESFNSSSEYVATDYHDYQSSNFESLDSSTETYATISEKEYPIKKIEKKIETEGKLYQKYKSNENLKRGRKVGYRKSVGTYFEVLKLRNEVVSPSSNDDNTSADYENLESLPHESVSDKIGAVSDRIEIIFSKSPNINLTEDNLDKHDKFIDSSKPIEENNSESTETTNNVINETLELDQEKGSKITDSIPVFEADEESNEIWYASASDPEDEEQNNIYRNNPVLECMNQILLQNINDNLNSPPKTPTIERRNKNNKRVKFSDEEDFATKLNTENLQNDYYETPIQKIPNFYETPQSIYSNDYEQILSQCGDTGIKSNIQGDAKNSSKDSHYYVDMDTKSDIENDGLVRKSKILRIPPALPPKPANLLSKYKIQNVHKSPPTSTPSIESEPDYCSISELNLPTDKVSKKINDSVPLKSVEIVQVPKPTSPVKIKPVPPVKVEPEIPKLPQVSEIIIPEETESTPKEETRINHDNYMINNTQILKIHPETTRRSISIGSSVSSLITGFNNQQLLSEINKTKSLKGKLNKKMFSSFESLQNFEKRSSLKQTENPETPNFDQFDLSQNFEEFKLDDCEMEEEYNTDHDTATKTNEEHVIPDILTSPTKTSTTRVELVRATNNPTMPQLNGTTVQALKKKLELDKNKDAYQQEPQNAHTSEPSYEHFLECTGLSSKSILTPSRLLSNHKSMLKPKDVKLRSKVKTNIFERQGSTIKYWSEPYI